MKGFGRVNKFRMSRVPWINLANEQICHTQQGHHHQLQLVRLFGVFYMSGLTVCCYKTQLKKVAVTPVHRLGNYCHLQKISKVHREAWVSECPFPPGSHPEVPRTGQFRCSKVRKTTDPPGSGIREGWIQPGCPGGEPGGISGAPFLLQEWRVPKLEKFRFWNTWHEILMFFQMKSWREINCPTGICLESSFVFILVSISYLTFFENRKSCGEEVAEIHTGPSHTCVFI